MSCLLICAHVLAQAPNSIPESILLPKKVRQEGDSGEAVGRGLGWMATSFFSLSLSRPCQIQYFLPVQFLLQSSTTILCPDLSALVVYLRTAPFCSFTHSKENYHIYDISSFSESKAKNLIREAGQEKSGMGHFRSSRQGSKSQETEQGSNRKMEFRNLRAGLR